MNPSALRSFEIPGIATFVEGAGGLTALDIATPAAHGRIYVHGAHITAWTPTGAAPVLFTSRESLFAPGKAIRGGVPICFPWFAARAGHPKSPAHGFVRTSEWAIEALVAEPDGSVSVAFIFTNDDATQAHWPHAFFARFTVRMGATLEMALTVNNLDPAPITYEAALHTYFCVSAIQAVEITGLEGATYIDKVEAFAEKQQPAEPLRFFGETDRVFPGTTATCVLKDPGLNREIVVEKSDSATTVVWNPWIAKAAAMADFADDEWPGMACIETANAGPDSITLAPGTSHTMTAKISLR